MLHYFYILGATQAIRLITSIVEVHLTFSTYAMYLPILVTLRPDMQGVGGEARVGGWRAAPERQRADSRRRQESFCTKHAGACMGNRHKKLREAAVEKLSLVE